MTASSSTRRKMRGRGLPEGMLNDVNAALIAPIRHGDRYLGFIVADRGGESFQLTQGELDLSQAMANLATSAGNQDNGFPNQDDSPATAGKYTLKLAPCPRSLSTAIAPPV